MMTFPRTLRRLAAGAVALSVLVFAGCDKRGGAGGPGATAPDNKPMYGQSDNTFNLTTGSMSVQQGESEKSAITIKRGTNFNQDVTVAFSELPKGVTVDSASHVIKNGESEVQFTLAAAEDTAPGDYTVKITGHPATGGDATNEFKVSVAKRDSFTLNAPFWTTALKQGETRIVTIGISRDKRFDQDVTLKINDLPKGVTAEPASVVIKAGEKEGKLSLKAADDAPLGDHAITMTGHPSKGADSTNQFKFTVARK
jgi:hypothetical protein